jgi:UDP-N-acetyl-D-mannosaminuronic acid transferase (WecB/TagA/CpsF family)
MTRFIYIKDIDKRDHYLNVHHIVRVTKHAAYMSMREQAYVILRDGKEIALSVDQGHTYDTYDDVIAKIGVALA